MKNSVIKRSILTLAAVTCVATAAWAASTSTKGTADRITVRVGYAPYAGAIDLRDSASGAVTTHYWGGDRCVGVTAPTSEQVTRLLDAHEHGRAISLDYNNAVTALYGTSRCWDGGIIIW